EVLGRAALYEHLQELHKNQAAPAVLFADGVDARLVADAADLPRLRILLERRPGADEVVKALAALGIPEGRVARPGAGELEEGVVEFDVVVTTAAAVLDGRNDRLIEHADAVVLEAEPGAEEAVRLTGALRRRGFEAVGLGQPP